MTMLDRMRRHKAWLKWSLGIVVVAFVLLYVPQFPHSGDTAPRRPTSSRRSTAAASRPTRISASTTQQVSQLRASYGQMTDDMIQQLGLGQRRSCSSWSTQEADAGRGRPARHHGQRRRTARAPAPAAGVPGERRSSSATTRYRQMLAACAPAGDGRPSSRTTCASRCCAEKLQAAVTGWIRVSDADVEQEYRRRATRRSSSTWPSSTASQFRAGIQPTDAELAAEFAAHKDAYKVPEKRRVRYLSIDADSAARQGHGDAAGGPGAVPAEHRRRTPRPNRYAPATSCSRPRARTTPR